MSVVGTTACVGGSGPGTVNAIDLRTGALLWSRTYSFLADDFFTDGQYFYGWIFGAQSAGLETYNTLGRWTPGGEFTIVRVVLPGLEDDPKNTILNGIPPSLSYYHTVHVDGTKIFWDSESPYQDNKTGSDVLPGGGGLMTADLALVSSTPNADELEVVAHVIYPRTRGPTFFDSRMESFAQDGTEYLVFAEIFNVNLDTDPVSLVDGVQKLDEEYAAQHVAIRCISLSDNHVVWSYVDPYAFRFLKLTPYQSRIFLSTPWSSALLDRMTGVPVWKHAGKMNDDTIIGNGGNGLDNVAFDNGNIYINKYATNDPNGLEAVDLATGNRVWAKKQWATQTYGIAVENGLVFSLNQTAVRLYRETDGKYLALDESIQLARLGDDGNASFFWTNPDDGKDHFIIFGETTTYSVSLNYGLDQSGSLVKL